MENRGVIHAFYLAIGVVETPSLFPSGTAVSLGNVGFGLIDFVKREQLYPDQQNHIRVCIESSAAYMKRASRFAILKHCGQIRLVDLAGLRIHPHDRFVGTCIRSDRRPLGLQQYYSRTRAQPRIFMPLAVFQRSGGIKYITRYPSPRVATHRRVVYKQPA